MNIVHEVLKGRYDGTKHNQQNDFSRQRIKDKLKGGKVNDEMTRGKNKGNNTSNLSILQKEDYQQNNANTQPGKLSPNLGQETQQNTGTTCLTDTRSEKQTWNLHLGNKMRGRNYKEEIHVRSPNPPKNDPHRNQKTVGCRNTCGLKEEDILGER